MKETNLKVGDSVKLFGLNHKVETTIIGYYLSANCNFNNVIFTKNNIKAEELCENTLGYYIYGDFPYCKTLEDLTKLVNALKEIEMKKDKKIKPPFKMYVPDNMKDEVEKKAKELGFDTMGLKDCSFLYVEKNVQLTGIRENFYHFKEIDKDYLEITAHDFLQLSKEDLEPEKVVIKMNNSFSLTVERGRCYHNAEDISDFVEELVEHFDKTNFGKNNYHALFAPKSLIFLRTGCEESETTLVKWIEVYNEMKKTKK